MKVQIETRASDGEWKGDGQVYTDITSVLKALVMYRMYMPKHRVRIVHSDGRIEEFRKSPIGGNVVNPENYDFQLEN